MVNLNYTYNEAALLAQLRKQGADQTRLMTELSRKADAARPPASNPVYFGPDLHGKRSTRFDKNGFWSWEILWVAPDVARQRAEFHHDFVLPHPADRPGYVRTGLLENGHACSLALVDVTTEEYFERYRLWRQNKYYPVGQDLARIQEVTGRTVGFDSWLMRRLGLGSIPVRR